MIKNTFIKNTLLMLLVFATVFISAACTPETSDQGEGYTRITGAQAKEMMDTKTDYVIIDARTQEEYDIAHIEGAIMIPETEIAAEIEAIVPDKSTLILVYCRSGRRSKIAAEEMVKLGYTNVYEFGGIYDWEYGVVK